MRKYLFMIAYYGASAVYQGYMGLFYGEIGLNRSQIGMVNASAAVSALAVQPVWGAAGDRVKKRKYLLCLLGALSALILPSALLGRALWLQMIAAFVFYAFFSALLPLGDAVILSSGSKRIYGKIRFAGGLSYAFFSLAGGFLTGKMRAGYALWAVSILLAGAAVSSLLLEDGGGANRKKRNILHALKDKNLRALLMFMLPAQVAMGYYYGFFALYFMNLPHANHFLLGVGNLAAALSEIPYLLFSDRLFERFGAGKTMMAAVAAMALRFFMLGIAGNIWFALFSQLLNGMGYIAVGVSMAKHVAKNLPAEHAAGGQMLISICFYGASRLIGSLLGGFIAQKTGMAAMFMVSSAACALGLTCFFIYAARRRFRV